jgi:uncharacterized RDD family membrane protein YckC
MLEKQIVADPEVATNIQNRLVDPRDIKAIILTTTQDEPTIRGTYSPEQVAFATWADANKLCDSVLKNLPMPNIRAHIGPGSGNEGRTNVSLDIINSYFASCSDDKQKILAFIQFKGIPHYPPGTSGPRWFQLITICHNAKAQKHEIRLLDGKAGNDDIIPEYDATGRKLVEFRFANPSVETPATTSPSTSTNTLSVAESKPPSSETRSQPPSPFPDSSLITSQPAIIVYAGFWSRVIAYFIDVIVLSFVLKLFFNNTGFGIAIIIQFILTWLYFTLLESSSKQATLGKMATGIIVTDLHTRRISFGKANGRYWGKWVSTMILFIGYIMAGFTQKKQALHDIMAGTLVTRK